MKIIRLLSMLLLASQLNARAVPTFSMSETWSETVVSNTVTHVTSIVTNGAASLVFSGVVMTNVGPIGFDTFFDIGGTGVALYGDLWGLPDHDNPIISSYVPGATSATFKFYHNTPDTNGNPHYAIVKTLKLSWAGNVLSGTVTGRSGALGLEKMATSTNSTYPSIGSTSSFVAFGKFLRIIDCVYHLSNKVTTPASSPVPLNSGSCTVVGDFVPPTLTISSPAPNLKTSNPSIEVTGTITDNLAIFAPLWRLAGPGDDPSLGVAAFNDWMYAFDRSAGHPKTSTWTTGFNFVTLSPGTNWFWVSGYDYCFNVSPIVTRKFFYSVRSPLTLGYVGNGTVIGSKGVTNGAMLEIGRGYTVSGIPNDANTILRDWRDGSSNIISHANPWNFQMQENMTIVGNFVPNPFPAIAGTYSGLFYDQWMLPVGLATNSAGYVTLTVNADGGYSGTVLFGAQKIPLSGKLQFDSDDYSEFFSFDPDAVNVPFSLDETLGLDGRIRFASDGAGHLLPTPTVTITSSKPVIVNEVTLNPEFPPLPLTRAGNVIAAGLYNMGDADISGAKNQLRTSPVPSIGNSYGSITVTTNGRANVVMHMADGSAKPASFSGPVGADGSVTFFMPLYNGKGLVMGTVNITNSVVTNTESYWVKAANTNASYFPDGFVVVMDLEGGAYTPSYGTNLLTQTGVVHFEMGDQSIYAFGYALYVPVSNSFMPLPAFGLAPGNSKFNPSTGIISGNADQGIEIFSANFTNFHMLMCPPSSAYGYVLSTNESAAITFSKSPPRSLLMNYDDGYVLFGFRGAGTANFSYNNATQLTSTSTLPGANQALVMHKTIQVAPHQRALIIDEFENMIYVDPSSYLPIPAAPYTSPYDPVTGPVPGVTVNPVQRTVQYISN